MYGDKPATINEIRETYIGANTRNWDQFIMGRTLESERSYYRQRFDTAMTEFRNLSPSDNEEVLLSAIDTVLSLVLPPNARAVLESALSRRGA